MPTYAITSVRPFTAEERARIAQSVTEIHAIEATAPRYFVQVLFNALEPGTIFLGGAPASPDHVWVRADIRVSSTSSPRCSSA